MLLVPALLVLSSTPAVASAKNANLDGLWKVAGAGNGNISISDENVATGSFEGIVVGKTAGTSLTIVDGRVTRDTFTFTGEEAGTVVDEHGAQFNYGGTVDGNSMILTLTGLHVWSDGQPVDSTDNDRGPFDASRDTVDLSGTIDFGCSAGTTSCSSASGPLEDATVDVEGPTTSSTTTDTDGTWTVPVAPGRYTITPSAPNVTFSPDSIDVDVTKATDGQDFTSCAANSVGDTSSLRAPLLRDHASSPTWTLTGDYCYNFYSVIYNKATTDTTVTWIAKSYICDPSGAFSYDANLGQTFFSNALVGTSQAPGDVSKLAVGRRIR